MTTRWARVARGFVAATISLFVAAFCHIVSGGAPPTLFALTACLVVSTFVCVALSAKRLSLARLSTSVALSQFLFHSVFSLWTTEPTAFSHAGHVHDQLFLFVAPDAPGVPADAGMWIAHAMAAMVTIAALRYGETAFWGMLSVARLWIGSFFVRLVLTRPVRTQRPAAPVERILPLRELVLLHSSSHHRGPPAAGMPALAPA